MKFSNNFLTTMRNTTYQSWNQIRRYPDKDYRPDLESRPICLHVVLGAFTNILVEPGLDR